MRSGRRLSEVDHRVELPALRQAWMVHLQRKATIRDVLREVPIHSRDVVDGSEPREVIGYSVAGVCSSWSHPPWHHPSAQGRG